MLLPIPHASSGAELKSQHTAGLLRTWVPTQGRPFLHPLAFSSIAPARVLRDSISLARNPQAALFPFAKQSCIRRTHTVCFSNKHPHSGMTLRGTKAFLRAQEIPEPTYSHHVNVLTYRAVFPTDTSHSFNTQLPEIHTHRILMQRRQIRKHL